MHLVDLVGARRRAVIEQLLLAEDLLTYLVELFLAVEDENVQVLVQHLDPFTVLMKVAEMLICSVVIACRSGAFFAKVFPEVDVALAEPLPALESWIGVHSLPVAKAKLLLMQLLHCLLDFLGSKLTVEHDSSGEQLKLVDAIEVVESEVAARSIHALVLMTSCWIYL